MFFLAYIFRKCVAKIDFYNNKKTNKLARPTLYLTYIYLLLPINMKNTDIKTPSGNPPPHSIYLPQCDVTDLSRYNINNQLIALY